MAQQAVYLVGVGFGAGIVFGCVRFCSGLFGVCGGGWGWLGVVLYLVGGFCVFGSVQVLVGFVRFCSGLFGVCGGGWGLCSIWSEGFCVFGSVRVCSILFGVVRGVWGWLGAVLYLVGGILRVRVCSGLVGFVRVCSGCSAATRRVGAGIGGSVVLLGRGDGITMWSGVGGRLGGGYGGGVWAGVGGGSGQIPARGRE